MIPRWINSKLEQTLQTFPAVAFLGPRQVGKTTLARRIRESRPSLYLDLESPEDLLKLRDPTSFLSQNSDKLVILDEIQRVPDLFKVLRGVIDKNRQAGIKWGQFLFLGSASMDLLRQSSESLAGRISYIDMGGLNSLEIPKNEPANIQELWMRGGFPDSYLSDSDPISMEWLEMLIRTYLERDVPQMGFRVPTTRIRRLWTMLAHLQGETINHSKLACNLEVDAKTVSNYIDILADLLLVRRQGCRLSLTCHWQLKPGSVRHCRSGKSLPSLILPIRSAFLPIRIPNGVNNIIKGLACQPKLHRIVGWCAVRDSNPRPTD